MNAGACRGQRCWILVWGFQETVSPLTWLLGTELESSGGAASSLNYGATSPAPSFLFRRHFAEVIGSWLRHPFYLQRVEMNYRSPVAAMFLVSEKTELANRCFLFHLVLEVPGVSAIIASWFSQVRTSVKTQGSHPYICHL